MENHSSNGQLPIRVLFQESYRCILVVIHDQPLSSSDREKREHMTARECRNICLFGIDQVRIPEVGGCCGRTDSNPTLKLPSVIAGVGPVLEFDRASFPFHCRVMFRHVSIPLIFGEITFPFLQSHYDSDPDKATSSKPMTTTRPGIYTRLAAALAALGHPAHHDRHETSLDIAPSTGFDSASESRTRESEQAPRASDAHHSSFASRLHGRSG